MRKLKKLEDVISWSTVDWFLAEGGWKFNKENPDPLHPDFAALRQVYLLSEPEYSGKITVPVLFDKGSFRFSASTPSRISRAAFSEGGYRQQRVCGDYPHAKL